MNPSVREPVTRSKTQHQAVQSTAPSPARRVLVVDDNLDAATTLVDLLCACGITAKAVHDSRQVLGALRRSSYDAVLLDLGMPHLGGYELAMKIRRDPRHATLRLVAITGWNAREDIARSRDLGFHRHLPKPADLSSILDALA